MHLDVWQVLVPLLDTVPDRADVYDVECLLLIQVLDDLLGSFVNLVDSGLVDVSRLGFGISLLPTLAKHRLRGSLSTGLTEGDLS